MERFVFILFLFLCLAMVLSIIKKGPLVAKARWMRFLIVIASSAFFTYWFINESSNSLISNATSIEVINKLPQPLDFYIITVNKEKESDKKEYVLNHAGKIRADHYRSEFLKTEKSDEYWVAGYLGKKNMVYFSQHSLLDKNKKIVLEVNNYINQSMKLSKKAETVIAENFQDKIRKSVWITLSLLFLFLNIVLLIKKR